MVPEIAHNRYSMHTTTAVLHHIRSGLPRTLMLSNGIDNIIKQLTVKGVAYSK